MVADDDFSLRVARFWNFVDDLPTASLAALLTLVIIGLGLSCRTLFFLCTLVAGHVRATYFGESTSRRRRGVPHGSISAADVSPHSEHDVIIVGAGVAGASLAYALGRDGRRVLVLERDMTEPDRIVGELLQPGGFLKLKELGLEECVEGIDAQDVYGYVIFKDGQEAKVAYPVGVSAAQGKKEERKGSSDAEGKAPNAVGRRLAGRGFHNGRFVRRLREKAMAFPNVTMVEATVTSLVEDGELVKGVKFRQKKKKIVASEEKGEAEGDKGVEYETGEVYAPMTFVCDGCFSNLRRTLSKPKIDVPSSFVGLLLKDCPLPHSNYGHVVLADPSPILLYPVSHNEVRCLVDIPGSFRVPSVANGEMATYLKTKVCPQLPAAVQESFAAAVDGGDIRMMPNRIMPAVPVPRPGALLMGDAFNMRHPLTGGGMTVALSDVAVLSQMLRPLPDFSDCEAICQYAQAFYTRRKPVASTINTLATALYRVFCASPDPAMQEMRQACFDYLSLGGVCAAGPVALLSGLNPRPLSLVYHFFSVAIYGVGRLLLPFPTLGNLSISYRLIEGACNIIFPIIMAEGVLKMFFPALFPSYYASPPSCTQDDTEGRKKKAE